MTLTQIRYFIEAAKCCNLRQASEKLFVTQQVLSKQIKVLEAEIGFLLFYRERKRMYLTPAGKYMLEVWEPLLQEFQEKTERAFRKIRKSVKNNKIRIGIPDIRNLIDMVLPVVQRYMSVHTDMEIEFLVENINQLIQHFEVQELDMLIIFETDIRMVRRKYYKRELQKLYYGIICHKNHALAQKTMLRMEDVCGEKICVFDDSYARNAGDNVLKHYQAAGGSMENVKVFKDWKSMELALCMQQGVALTFETFLPSDHSQLMFLPIGDAESPLVAIGAFDNCIGVTEFLQEQIRIKK